MERSKRLHNFDLPPGLTWGKQRFLRCMNVNPVRAMSAGDDGESTDSGEDKENGSDRRRRAELEEFERPRGGRSCEDSQKRLRFKLSQSPAVEIGSGGKAIAEDEDEISATREKLVMDFQEEVGKLKDAILRNNTSDDEIPPRKVYPSSDEVEADSLPLNSKGKQKLTYNAPLPNVIRAEGGGRGGINDDPPSEKKSARPRRNCEKKEERPKFSVTLSRSEIEEDFIAMTGKKPPRKPNKRPKSLQNEIDALFPGSWLSEVHADLYKVNENGKP